jgi:hypothetical protein
MLDCQHHLGSIEARNILAEYSLYRLARLVLDKYIDALTLTHCLSLSSLLAVPHCLARSDLQQSYLLAHMMQQLATVHKVHHKVDFAGGLECVVQRGQERMANIAQDVALGQGVLHVVGLQQELLAQHLHGIDGMRVLLDHLEYLQPATVRANRRCASSLHESDQQNNYQVLLLLLRAKPYLAIRSLANQ